LLCKVKLSNLLVLYEFKNVYVVYVVFTTISYILL